MPGQLAARVRAKYPGEYDDMDDATLEKSVLAKYPEYADLVDVQKVGPELDHAELKPHHTSYIDALVEKYGPVVSDTWNKLNTPMVDIPDSSQALKEQHPIFAKIGDTVTGALESMTSPLSVGLMATSGLANVGNKILGKVPGILNKAAGGAAIAHGGYKVYDEPTLGGKLAGGLEAGLGALNFKGAKGKPLAIESGPAQVLHNDPAFTPVGMESEFNATRPIIKPPDIIESAFQNTANKAGMQVRPPEPIDIMIENLKKSSHPEAQNLLKKLTAQKTAMTVVQESGKPEVAGPVQKLISALDEAIPLQEEQKEIYRGQRSERFKKMEQVKTPGLAGHYERLGQLAGKYDKVQMEPMINKLEPEDVDHLVNAIQNDRLLSTPQKTNATIGLTRMLNGELPRDYERGLLKNVFGETFAGTIDAKLPLIDKQRSIISEAVNLPRSLMTPLDMSMPLRQGLPYIFKKEYWPAIYESFKTFGEEKAFKGIMESVQNNPDFAFGQEIGLSLTDMVNSREEYMASMWAESGMPLGKFARNMNLGETAGKFGDSLQKGYAKTYGTAVRRSNRMNTAFINKLRQDTLSSVLKTAELNGLDPRNNLPLSEALAGQINTLTGRGSLGKAERYAEILNTGIFSPRLIASRVKILNPWTYINPKTPALVRKEALKGLISIAGAGAAFMALGKVAGADIGLDPTSSDFGKIKFGNVRLDPWGGFQQYLVAATRLASGQSTSSQTGNVTDLTSGQYGKANRLDVIGKFGEQKLNPPLGFAISMLRGKDVTGKPFDITPAVEQLFTPMIIKDLYDISQEDPKLLPLGLPMFFGMGGQTYGNN